MKVVGFFTWAKPFHGSIILDSYIIVYDGGVGACLMRNGWDWGANILVGFHFYPHVCGVYFLGFLECIFLPIY